MSATLQPPLSVIVAATGGAAATRRVLADLAVQRHAPQLELIVVDGSGVLSAADVVLRSAKQAKLLSVPGADVAELRAYGARHAHGELLAFTEDLCRIPPDWCERLLRARAAGHRAFGGTIENGSYRSGADWAAYFVEFGPFIPPLVQGPVRGLPGMNVAYERRLIEDLVRTSLCEPIVSEQLRTRGVDLYQVPDLTVVLEHRFGVVAFARHCFRSGRTFARMRLNGVSWPRRVVYAAAASTALPLVLIARTTGLVFRRRWARLQLVKAIPWIALYSIVWASGEAVGALDALLMGRLSRTDGVAR
jgi:hypothetical protein